MKVKIKKYWRITYKLSSEYDTQYFAVIKAKTLEKAVERFYKEYRLRWYESASKYIVVKVENLEVNVTFPFLFMVSFCSSSSPTLGGQM